MNSDLPTKELIIAVIEKDGSILMRKKLQGSPPYKESWYSFVCDRIPGQDDSATIKNYLEDVLGINVEVNLKSVPFGTEIKKDHDGTEKNFIYINLLCKYISGNPKIPQGAERVEWIPKDKLNEYNIIPPAVKLLKVLGYMI